MDVELSAAAEESAKILARTDINERTLSLILAIPETAEAERAFLAWLQEHEERDLDNVIAAAKMAADRFPPDDGE